MKKFNEALKVLMEIYPPYILMLVFTPIVTGLIIDYDLFDSRDIAINLAWIPLLTIPGIFLKKRFIFQLISTFYFVVGFIEIGHWVILKGPITITSLLVMSNTNLPETIEYFDLKATSGLLILIPYVFIFILSLRYKPKYFQSQTRRFIIGFAMLIATVFVLENLMNERLIRKGVPQIAKVTFSFIEKRNLYLESMKETAPRNVNANSTLSEDKHIFVLILGESCNRKHMSLYGYTRKTNPRLEKRDDLIVYNDVVSAYSNTLNSVLSMLSVSNIEQPSAFENSIDIIDIFHSAGYKTYWISNQSPIGIWDNLVTVFAKKSDYFKFVNTSSNSSFEAILTTSYDAKLFTPFAKVLNEDVNRKFIVLHLMGSHSSYKKRYPSDFNIYSGENKKEQTIAEYDNSMLYNDFVVDSLLNMITNYSQQLNVMINAIYISDHGENIYDELDRVGHDYSNKLPKANVEVPFIIWFSQTFKHINPDKASMVKSNKNMPFVSDDLFHSIIDFNGIQSQYVEIERSIFSDRFNEKRKRFLEDGKDYDKE